MTTAPITVAESAAESAPDSTESVSLPAESNFAMTWADYFRPVTFAFWAMHLRGDRRNRRTWVLARRPGAGDRHATSSACSWSPPPITATSRTGRSRRRAVPVPAGARRADAPRKRACSGGRATTAGTTSTPTLPAGRPLGAAARASGTRTSAGSWPRLERDRRDRSSRPGQVTPSCASSIAAASPAARGRAARCLLLPRRRARAWSGAIFVSTVMLWHGSFSINSLSHLFGRGATTPATTRATTGCWR